MLSAFLNGLTLFITQWPVACFLSDFEKVTITILGYNESCGALFKDQIEKCFVTV